MTTSMPEHHTAKKPAILTVCFLCSDREFPIPLHDVKYLNNFAVWHKSCTEKPVSSLGTLKRV